MIVARSRSTDPQVNLAQERRLLDEGGAYVLFYINAPSVIIGRNQSAAAEADLEFCRASGIPVVRRISGGGAVYHDLGNVNYAFIADRSQVPPLDGNPAGPIIRALASMGVEATVGSRGELLVGGRKVSGTAAYAGAKRQMFHGTLLHSTDLVRLEQALRGDPAQRGRKIASVPGRVMNLGTLPRTGRNAEDFMERLIEFFRNSYGCSECMQLGGQEP